jgi:hypothetical protein
MAQIHEICDKSCEILQRTNDGDDLEPKHLKLIEMAVNGELNEKGIEALNELHKMVMTTGYKKPFFHSIEHLTIDNIGYVYWKGKQVEHYTLSWAYSEGAHKSATELARRCKIIEGRGEIPNSVNAIWSWKD